MIKEHDYLYRILGLQPGASPVKIKSAYRKLVKLYHPDRDQSPDTGIMYKEIREAYEKLMDLNHKSGIYTKTVIKTSTVGSHSSYNQTRTSDFDTKEFYDSFSSIPFEFKNLRSIFFRSLNEMYMFEIFVGIVALVIACLPAIGEPFAILAVPYHIVSWVLFVILRYYFRPSDWFPLIRALAAILYGTILSLLIFYFYMTRDGEIWFTAVISILLLML